MRGGQSAFAAVERVWPVSELQWRIRAKEWVDLKTLSSCINKEGKVLPLSPPWLDEPIVRMRRHYIVDDKWLADLEEVPGDATVWEGIVSRLSEATNAPDESRWGPGSPPGRSFRSARRSGLRASRQKDKIVKASEDLTLREGLYPQSHPDVVKARRRLEALRRRYPQNP